MNMTIDVPDEFIDAIIEEALTDSYHNTVSQIKALKKLKKLKEYQQEDLQDMTKYLEALEIVGSWFVWEFRKKVGIK